MSRSRPPNRRSRGPNRRSGDFDDGTRNWQQYLLFGLGGLFLVGAIGVMFLSGGLPGGPTGPADNTTTATDSPTATATPSPTPTPTDEVVYRINVGGGRIAAADAGPAWQADTGASPSPYLNVDASNTKVSTTPDTVTLGPSIEEPVPEELFASYRFDQGGGLFSDPEPMAYEFPTDPSHTYEVRVYTVEPFLTNGEPPREGERSNAAGGPRVFDIRVEGDTVVDDLEILSEAGHDVAMVETVEVSPNDGRLTIDFPREAENPTVSAIEIVDKGDAEA